MTADTTDPMSIETLRGEINWKNITEESYSDGSRDWPFFILHPDNPEWPKITLFTGPGGIHELCVGDDGAHFHLGRGTTQAIDLARELVAKEKSVVVTYFENGVLESWKLVSKSGWPDTFLKYDMPLDDSGTAALVDLDGNHYFTPKFTRILFNQEPFPDVPDFSSYVTVKCGWMTPEKRDAVLEVMRVSGQLGENALI